MQGRIQCRIVLAHSDFIMQNHRVHGVSVMPGVTLLDLVYRILAARGMAWERAVLHDVLFSEPIATADGTDRDIRVTLAETDGGRWNVTVESRRTGDARPEPAWNENLRCGLAFDAEPEPEPVDVRARASAAVRTRDMDELYAQARAEGIRHGGPMTCRGPLYEGDGYLLAELTPAEARVPDGFHLHPAILDASTIAAFGRTAFAGRDAFIPVFIERFRAPRRTGARAYAFVPAAGVLAPSSDVVRNDYVVCDENGRMVCAFERLTCKRIRSAALITRLVADPVEPAPARTDLVRHLRDMVSRFVGRPASEIRTDTGFYDLGLDSVMLLQMSRELEEVVGAPLYPTLLFEFTDIAGLAAHLEAQYGTRSRPAAAPETATVCYREVWEPLEERDAPPLDAVVLVGEDDETDRSLARELERTCRVRRLSLGTREELLRALAAEAQSPRAVVCLVPSRGRDAGDALVALRAIVSALIDTKPQSPCSVCVLTARSDERDVPLDTALGAAGRTIAEETPVLRCRAVGFDAWPGAEQLADVVRREIASVSAEHVVRYRAGRRFVRRFTPYALDAEQPLANGEPERRARFEPGGAYVISGGAGGIGTILADRLARGFRARLLLAGRSAPDEPLSARIAGWNALGAQVHYVQADVAQRAGADAVLARARELFGNVDGIVHLAGVHRDAVFFQQRDDDVRATIAAKVQGAVHLDAASASDAIDLFVVFSSIAATVANPGQSDYAYANAALESFADLRARRTDRTGKTLAIAWPLWAEGGMRIPAEAIAAACARTGLTPLPSDTGFELLAAGLAGPEHRFVVAHGERAAFEARIAQASTAASRPALRACTEPAPGADSDVAIVGLAGRYPQAPDLDTFWQNLLAGRDCISEIPRERWDHEPLFDAERGSAGKTYGRWGGFLDGVDRFDAAFFGISRKDAEQMDPQERLFLTIAWQTFEDAGYRPAALGAETVGSFVGVMWNHYQLFSDGGVAPAALHASVANRVSYCLDLRGPSIAVDTSCSSSLTALHLAVESIRRGDCTLALAGGVNVTIHPQKYLQLAHGQFLSDDGRCRSFGAGGTGYVPGEGVGAVLLKPLARARADRDHVYAVVKSAVLNHSGRTSGFTVPSPVAQAALIRQALARAGVDPRTIGYVEAHGTGTALGDPIEIEGLRRAFDGAGAEPGRCAVGSVKSNIGHLESAAGIAGLTKVLLQMRYRMLVPSLHAERTNPHIAFDSAPVRLQREAEPWIANGSAPLRAGVSSFGAGGANAHVVVESAEYEMPAPRHDGPALFVLSARDRSALVEYAAAFEAFIERAGGSPDAERLVRAAAADVLSLPPDALGRHEPLGDLGFDAVTLAALARRLEECFPHAGARIAPSLETTIDAVGRAYANARPPGDQEQLALDDVAFTLQVGRTPMAARLAVVALDLDAVRAALRRFVGGEHPGADAFWELAPDAASSAAPAESYAAWFRAGRLHELARSWVTGADVPWESCYPRDDATPAPRRVSLPTYPFREQSYWVGGWTAARAKAGGATAPAEPAASPVELRVLEGGIALVTMCDAAHGNMLSDDVLAGLGAAFDEIRARRELKAVVVAGTGDAFCMGATPRALERLAGKEAHFTDVPFVYEGLLRCEIPVVAAMQGHAFGGGLAFGLYADVVVMSRDHVYGANFLKYGFTPGMGATYIVERKLGSAVAAEMLFTGRDVPGAELEKRSAQIVFHSHAGVLPAALELARSIAEKPPAAVRELKKELAGRVLEALPGIVSREAEMHDRVLGDSALERVQTRLRTGPAAAPPVVEQAPARAGRDEVRAAVEQAVCAQLYLAPDEIDHRLSFSEMGVDSIGAVKIVRDLNVRFALDLDSVAIYDHPTVPRLADHVAAMREDARALRMAASSAAPVVLEAVVRDSAVRDSAVRDAVAPVVLKPVAAAADELPKLPRARRGDIAVIGMSGRFPDAPDLGALWENLIAGRSSVREVPAERWDVARVFDPDVRAPNKTNGRWAALLDGVDRFDPAFFNVSPFEAETMDPEQRLFLEEAWKALEDAGYAVFSDRKKRCGVFVGCTPGDYVTLLDAVGRANTGEAFLGNSTSVLAARIAYMLDLSGPTVAIDTACSSSLVAVHLACESIRSGECETALAGGVALMLTPQLQIRTSKLGILSPSGRCATFDADADGITLGEGVGVVVLKSLERALADGDHVHAVIVGSGINGDGKTNGITAPSAASQEELLARVYERAGVDPGDVGYVEAHGTGTVLGDPIEFKALDRVFRARTARRGYCGIGSIKSNLGHTTMAAGIAGLLKVLLAMRHGQIPPSLNVRTVNPKIDLTDSPFYVVSRATGWDKGPSGVRVGAVSSFGFSGTNAHVVVSDAPERPGDAPADRWFVIPVSARTPAALTTRLRQLVDAPPGASLRDVAFTLSAGRRHLPLRAAFVVRSTDDLRRSAREVDETGNAGEFFRHAGQPPDAAVPFDESAVRELGAAAHGPQAPPALRALAEAYVRGYDPDWAELYRGSGARRVPLPPYPFDRERHWIDLPAPEQHNADFVWRIDPDDRVVGDHRVAGTPLLPGAVALAMAASAAARRGMARVRLAGVRWPRPFEVKAPRDAHFSAATQDGVLRFELAPGDDPNACTAYGSIVALGECDAPPRVVDLAAVAARCRRSMPRAELYAAFDAAHIAYGPAYRLVDGIAFCDDEALGTLSAPADGVQTFGELAPHPSLLDAALQVVAPLAAHAANGPLLPFSVESVRIDGPLDGPGFAHATRDAEGCFTIELTDVRGRVCVLFERLVLRARDESSRDMIFVPAWREAGVPPVHAGSGAVPERIAVVCAPGAEEPAHALRALQERSETIVLSLEEAARGELPRAPYDAVYVLAGTPASDDDLAVHLRVLKALIASAPAPRRLALTVVLRGAVAARDEDVLRPHAAALLAMVRALAAEHPSWSVQAIDADIAAPADLARAIAAETFCERLVALRGGRRLVRVFEPAALTAASAPGPFRSGGAYLIVGGAGGIGTALSRHLAQTAGARLAWVGRRPLTADIRARIDEIGALGGEAVYLQADATDAVAMRGAVAEVRRRFGRIDGAFHGALVLADAPLATMDEGAFRAVFAPKSAGAANLVDALRDAQPDFVAFFSSAASFADAGGQANYAAASAFQDAFALALRREARFRVCVVNWGFWGSVGAVALDTYRRRFAALGVGSIEPARGLAALATILASDVAQALVIEAEPRAIAALGVGGPTAAEPAAAREAFAALDALARHLLAQSFERCRDVAPQHARLFAALTAVRRKEPAPEALDAEDLVVRFPALAPHVRLLQTCIDALPDVLAGRRAAVDVLFPNGSAALVEPVYRGRLGADYYHELLAREAASAAQSSAARSGHAARILEIGAGTGSATTFVLDACASRGVPVALDYTDVSPAFLRHGERLFADATASVAFRTLDLEREPAEQGFTRATYDVVVASNVLHATRDVDAALARVHGLVRPGGCLLVNEITRGFDFLTLTFGLTNGWWAFEDAANRLPDAPLLGPRGWCAALARAGFRAVRTAGLPGTPADDLEQCLFVAQKLAVAAAAPALEVRVGGYLKRVFAETLKFAETEIDERKTFEHFGVDSLVGMNVLHALERDLGALPSTLLFEHTTIERLARHLATECGERVARLLEPEPAVSAAAAPALRDAAAYAETRSSASGEIAIVGVSGRYPGAADVEELWTNLAAGVCSVREIPAERWDWRENFDPRRGRPHKSYSRWGAFLDGIDLFDPAFFGILARDARTIDPQERLFLETCWNLLEENGYLGEGTHEPRTGVFAGMMYGTYGLLGATRWAHGELAGAHSAYWSVANRASYFFDFTGPSLAVDSACSSSLTAVHLACESIRRGECAMAIAGGVNLVLHPAHHASLCALNMLSSDGACKVFDAKADGIVPGEGVGAVLLKPLDRALADGDDIWGVVKGSFTNAGGKTGGYTVPNPNAQAELVSEALRRAGVDARTVTYVEAHGTGTELGDPIEIAGLAKAFRGANASAPHCAVASVKANLGHLEGAAGIAGLTKVLLQLRHGRIAPCANLGETNPKIDLASSPFFLPTRLIAWERPVVRDDTVERIYPRRAGISSFGAGGANVHVILEEHGALEPAPPAPDEGDVERLFALSAATPRRLRAYAERVAAFLRTPQARTGSLAGLAFASQTGRREMAERLCVTARSKAELAELLDAFARGEQARATFAGAVSTQPETASDDALFEEPVDLSRLARAWVGGARIDWRRAWREPVPKRAPFPTSPFEKRSYWYVERGAEDVVVDPGAFYADHHRIDGSRRVPGAALLESARAAARFEAPLQIREIEWPSPLNLGDEPALAAVRLAREGNQVRFRTTAPGDASKRFAAGVFAAAEPNDGTRTVDLTALRVRCAVERDGSDLYESFGRAGLAYGAALRVVEHIHVGAAECVARIVLPPDPGDQPFGLHPALLDGALQTVAALCDGTTRYLPVGAEQLVVHRSPPPRCVVHARETAAARRAAGERSFDLDVFDEEGRALMAVVGLRIVPAPASATVREYSRPAWTRAELEGEPRAAERLLIVSDDDALAAALERRHADAETRCTVVAAGEPEQWPRRAEELDATGSFPDAVVYAGARDVLAADADALRAQLRRGVGSLLSSIAALLARGRERELRVVYAYRCEDGALQPQHAAIAAACKTIALEHSRVRIVHVRLEGADAEPERAAARIDDELLRCRAGADTIRYRDGERSRTALEPFDPLPASELGDLPLRAGGTYLVAGGAGALGLRFAQFLTESAAVNVVLVGRDPLDAERSARIEALCRPDASVRYVRADVTSLANVQRVVAEISESHGVLRGVIHAAGVRRDAPVMRKTPGDVEAVVAPKAAGALNLDAATSAAPIDFFVLFSSIVGETGNPGQADYAFANAFLNEFAELRESRRRAGLRCGKTVAIGWPLWREGGMTVDDATRRLFERNFGMVPMSTHAGLAAFRQALAGSESRFTVVERLAGPRPPAAGTSRDVAPDAGANALPLVEGRLRAMAAKFMLVDERDVEMRAELLEIGFDSVSLTELVNEVNEEYGLDLLPTVLFEYTNLASFARYLVDAHAAAVAPHGPQPAAEREPAPPATPPELERDDVAIVGIAGRLPGSEDVRAFWRHLVAADDLVGGVPSDRAELREHPATRSVRGGFVADVDCFDAAFFGISPHEAALMDPQQRLFQETVWHAIQDAGYKLSDLAGSTTGLFAGVGTSDYADLLRARGTEVEAHSATGIAHSILANRISHRLDLRGPSEAVDTACSSSLVAVHRAVRAIRAGECDVAIAGGVNVLLSPALFGAFFKSGMLSASGACKTFDRDADGYVRGEGAGAIVLKPLRTALEDGDHVYAVVAGSAVNHCGKTASLTAPSAEGQARVLMRAYRDAAIDPRLLSYIEAHGTGTKLGDPIEIEGLKTALAALYSVAGVPPPAEPHVAVGSVKPNVGHLEAAAGIAGLLKVVLCIEHGELPPSVHLGEVNPYLRLDGSPLSLQRERRTWAGVEDENGRHVRCAGVSSFGFGGTNAHVVLTDGRSADQRPRVRVPGPWAFPLSAPGDAALGAYAARLVAHLRDAPDVDLGEVAYTLQVGRDEFPMRCAAVAADRELLIAALTAAARGEQAAGLYAGSAGRSDGVPADETGLDAVAARWVRGAAVEWKRLWPRTPRRVPLPVFPLAKTRYWFDARVEKKEPDVRRTDRAKVRLAPAAAPEIPVAAADAPAAQIVKARLSEILGVTADEIAEDRSFAELGLDSIYGMELIRLLNEAFSLDLKAAELYDHDSVAALAAFVAARKQLAPARTSTAVLEEELRRSITELVDRPIEPERTFADNGLTSFDMLRVVSALEKRFRTLRKSLLFEHPTLAALAAHLAGTNGTSSSAEPHAPVELAPPSAGAEPAMVRKSELAGDPELERTIEALRRRYGKEGGRGLAGRDIAPLIFVGSRRLGYFNVAQQDRNLLAFSYVGEEAYLAELASEYLRYARRRGCQPNLLSLVRLVDVDGTPFSATPFGVVQRIDDLARFTLEGSAMRRLRYAVTKFARGASCSTVEYRSGSDTATDSDIAELLDAWCATKKMINPYVATVREELRKGRLGAAHRIFLTYRNARLSNAVVITRLPSENGHLLDLEFYPETMPLGGLEFTIVRIFEQLLAEGCTTFSFGASFGVKTCDSPNADAETERSLNELRALHVFDGSGNYQFKNKFRPHNLGLFLCRPAEPDATPVSDIVLMIANPDVVAPCATERDPERVEFDLVTDSWSEIDAPFVDARIGELHARRCRRDAARDLAAQSALPFGCVVPTVSGRAAEVLLCRAWPSRDGIVLHNGLFPSWAVSLAENGFVPVVASRTNGGGPFAGDLDVPALDALLERHSPRVRFVCVELGNNAIGGAPTSLANLARVAEAARGRGVPLVLDATRIVDNAVFVAAHEDGRRGTAPWDVVREMLALADAVTLSLSKDFRTNFGGLVATNDERLGANLREHAARRGPDVNLANREMIALVLDDRAAAVDAVRERMACVALLRETLARAGVPVVDRASGHCVLIDVARIASFAGVPHAREACLAWIERRTGIRAAPHLAGIGEDELANRCIRMAVPVGLARSEIETIAARLASLFAEPGAPGEGERALRELAPGVERHVLRTPDGEVEAFAAGDGPALLLVHPFNVGAGAFGHQFAAFADRFRVIAIHLPGVGATTAARDLSLDGLADLIVAALRALEVDAPVHLAGTSFGGLVAQSFALRHPERVASMTLVGSSYKAGNRTGQIGRLETIVAEDFDRVIELSGSERLRRDRERFERILLRCESMNPLIGLRYLDEFAANPDLLESIPRIAVPAMIVQGRYDSIIPLETAHRLRDAIRGARYEEIADAGHFPYLTSADEFNRLLAGFVARCEESRFAASGRSSR